MIYLIWWSPRCWKTTLSTSIQKNYDIPCLHLDQLMWTYFNSLTKEKQQELFPIYSLKNWDAERFDRYTMKENIDIELKEWRNMTNIILNIIKDNSFSFQDYIIEWVHLTPELVRSIIDKNGTKVFKTVFIINTSCNNILKWIRSHLNTGWECWLKWLPDDCLNLYSSFISIFSEEIINQCNRFWFNDKLINMSEDFRSKIISVSESI